MLETTWQDVRYALRALRLTPGFTLVALLSLALGTGGNTAIFQLLDGIRLRTLPVKAPRELVELRVDDMTHARGNWLRDAALTNPLWEEIRAHQEPFSGVFAWADESFDISHGGESREVKGLWVSGDFFHTLGVQPLLGRTFTPRDDHRGCGLSPGAVISYGFWQRAFGGDPSVVGRQIFSGHGRIVVTGVTPPSFFGLEVGRTFDVALPICSEPAWHGAGGQLDSGITWWLTVMGRLKPGVSMEQAAARLRVSSAGIFEATLPKGYPAESVKPYLAMNLLVLPAGSGISHLRQQYSRPLILLLVLAALVLAIACTNLASLMLARAAARQREMAVRLAMGASRARIARQLITESLLLAIGGASLGLLLAREVDQLLVSFLTTGSDRVFLDLSQDSRVFAFAALLAILTCLLFASIPILRTARLDPGELLQSAARGGTANRRRRGFRRLLVASQIAFALVLVTGSLLFVRSLKNLESLDPGFESQGLLIADLDDSRLRLPDGRSVVFRRELLRRLRSVPGVENAAEAGIVPLGGGNWNNRVWMEGSDSGRAHVSMRNMIGVGYFRTMRTPLIAGRDFSERELGSLSKVAIVNEEFARVMSLSADDAIGRRFWVEATPYAPQTVFEIVGVVKNAKYQNLREPFQPIVYTPLSRVALEAPAARLLIRSGVQSPELVSSVRSSLAAVSPEIRFSFRFLDDRIEDSLLRERLVAQLSSVFGLVAAVLIAVGLYGVISYTVVQRTKEIGIRVALGATRPVIVALVMREAAVIVAAGLGVGTLLALSAGHAASALLFDLKSSDPLTLTIAGISLAAVAAAASYLPAWRASRVNPVIALRHD